MEEGGSIPSSQRSFNFVWKNAESKIKDVTVEYMILQPHWCNDGRLDSEIVLEEKRVKLTRSKDGFQLRVWLPAHRIVLYRFEIRGVWTVNKRFPVVRDRYGNQHNILEPITSVPGRSLKQTESSVSTHAHYDELETGSSRGRGHYTEYTPSTRNTSAIGHVLSGTEQQFGQLTQSSVAGSSYPSHKTVVYRDAEPIPSSQTTTSNLDPVPEYYSSAEYGHRRPVTATTYDPAPPSLQSLFEDDGEPRTSTEATSSSRIRVSNHPRRRRSSTRIQIVPEPDVVYKDAPRGDYYPPSPDEGKQDSGYHYLPLDLSSQEIRILVLNLPPDDESGISCSLEHVPLFECGPYIALSYRWGEENDSTKILMGSTMVSVTNNLYYALRAILKARHVSVDDESKSIRVWVDAVCINQQDHQEKSQQLLFMRQIYAQAEEVVAWVGPTDGSILSFEDTESLQDIPISERGCELTDTQLRVASLFFSEPYWKRVWVIQEITVASKLSVLYGDCEFQWDDVVAILSLLKDTKAVLEKLNYKTFLEATHLLDFRDKYARPAGIGLLEAMTWSRSALATEPRDKIFALLGLSHDSNRIVRVPNYTQSLGSIIAAMSKSLMSLNMSLDLICLKGVGESLDSCSSMPTWATNWPKLWSGTLTIQEEHLIQNPTIGSSNPILNGSTSQVLKVKAARVGFIRDVTTTMTPKERSIAKAPRKGWISATAMLRKRHPELADASTDSIKTCHGIWKTLTMNQLPPDFDESVGMACFEPLWRPEGRGAIEDLNLIQWIDDNAHFVIGRWTIREWSQIKPANRITQSDEIDEVIPSNQRIPFQPVDTIGESFDWIEIKQGRVSLTAAYSEDFYTSSNFNTFIGAIHRVLESGMKLANIDNGRCPAAMVHPDAEINDEIFYIRGCSIPVVLRKKNDRYMVIGGAYLHEDLKDVYLAAEDLGRPSFLKEISLC